MTPRKLYKRLKETIYSPSGFYSTTIPEFIVTRDDLEISNDYALYVNVYVATGSGGVKLGSYSRPKFKECFVPANALDTALCHANYPELIKLLNNGVK